MHRVRHFVFATNAILLCLVSIRIIHAEDPPKAEWGPKTAGCQFSLSANREEYPPGAPIELKMKLDNMSSTSVNGFSDPTDIFDQPHYRVELKSSDGKPVPLTALGERLSSGRFYSGPGYEILPGKTESLREPDLNNYFKFDMSEIYTLTIYRRYGYDKKWLEIPSNTVKFTILDKEVSKHEK